ncbi:hypothetical protein [Hymenobacter algoricola]|uniref:Uncharacterized protein n=1 Tax=Hymenobacter algoricola TaxID=486267 RepID=A0ABP7NJ66_9BACT
MAASLDRLVFARNPPNPIRRELLAGLLSAYQQWQQQLSARHQPFYLAVWLFEPHFNRSQVVAGTQGWIAGYKTAFGVADPHSSLPPEIYRQVSGVNQLIWTRHADTEVYDSFPYWLPNRKVTILTAASGETRYAARVGWVWVGRTGTAAT